MASHVLKRSQVLHTNIEKCWEFFSTPTNLAKITPPEMGFDILSKVNDTAIFSGMQIEYKVKPVLNIPMYWKTEIQKVDSPYQFTDIQLKGPYKKWVHIHKFEKMGANTLMIDEVNYELPLWWLGELVHEIFIRKKLKAIFDYRQSAISKFFS